MREIVSVKSFPFNNVKTNIPKYVKVVSFNEASNCKTYSYNDLSMKIDDKLARISELNLISSFIIISNCCYLTRKSFGGINFGWHLHNLSPLSHKCMCKCISCIWKEWEPPQQCDKRSTFLNNNRWDTTIYDDTYAQLIPIKTISIWVDSIH